MSGNSNPAPGAPAESKAQTLTRGAYGAASKKVKAGASAQNGGNDGGVIEEATTLLAVNPPTWPWVLSAFGILAAGTALSYLVWRSVKPADFLPSANYATYAGLFIMALAIERILEPFSGLFIPTTKEKKARSRATTARAKDVQIAITSGVPRPPAAVPVGQAQTEAAVAQTEFHRAQGARAVLMWATASVLAMLVCAALGIFLLRSVETPSPAKGTTAATSVSSSSAHSPAPSPAKDPNRLLDLLATGLVVGAGTKPLHDLISQIQTSSGNSKAKASSTTTAG
jgi:hypothetical protein